MRKVRRLRICLGFLRSNANLFIRCFMISHTKSIIAVILAITATVLTWVWASNLNQQRKDILAKENALTVEITNLTAQEIILNESQKKLKEIQNENKALLERLATAQRESSILISNAVAAASASGMEMTGTTEAPSGNTKAEIKNVGITLNSVAYSISLKGSYVGMVKFLQNINRTSKLMVVKSIEIFGPGNPASDEINAKIILGVFSKDN